jgi:hypothetical protein
MSVTQQNFDSISSLFEGNNIYVIPTFQRPFAWEEKQRRDLWEDIRKATNNDGLHYLAPLHVVEVFGLNRNPVLWGSYTDSLNSDIVNLEKSDWKDEHGRPYKVYMVVDGQQRLISLFTLLISVNWGGPLTTVCQQKVKLPKIILNPRDDHDYFRGRLNLTPSISTPSNKSALRISALFDFFKAQWRGNSAIRNFVMAPKLCCLQIELDSGYGLQGFLTLNDRGKDLTTFEKLKALFMELDLTHCTASHPANIHNTFGNAYRVLETQECPLTEDQLVQGTAINIWTGTAHRDLPQKSATAIFDLFRDQILADPRAAGSSLHTDWLPTLSWCINYLDEFRQHLDGTAPSARNASARWSSRTVHSWYQLVYTLLGMSVRTMSALFRFRNCFPTSEWHEWVVGTALIHNDYLKTMLRTELARIRGQSGLGLGRFLGNMANEIDQDIDKIPDKENRRITPLDLAEMTELMVYKMGSVKPGNYQAMLGQFDMHGRNSNAQRAIDEWMEFITCYDGRQKFFRHLLMQAPDSKDIIFRYVLGEFEFGTYGDDVLFNGNLDLEHILPVQPPQPPHPPAGFASPQDYRDFVQTLGNKMFLDQGLNRALQNQTVQVKSSAYTARQYGGYKVAPRNQTGCSYQVGQDLAQVAQAVPDYKVYLELRRLQIVVFAVGRF